MLCSPALDPDIERPCGTCTGSAGPPRGRSRLQLLPGRRIWRWGWRLAVYPRTGKTHYTPHDSDLDFSDWLSVDDYPRCPALCVCVCVFVCVCVAQGIRALPTKPVNGRAVRSYPGPCQIHRRRSAVWSGRAARSNGCSSPPADPGLASASTLTRCASLSVVSARVAGSAGVSAALCFELLVFQCCVLLYSGCLTDAALLRRRRGTLACPGRSGGLRSALPRSLRCVSSRPQGPPTSP